MPQIIPAYVINLDRRPDRWETISANLDRIGVKAERVPAVDARLLERQEQRRIEHGNDPLYKISLGSAANMCSQSTAMERFLRTDAPACLILEDDAELANDTASLLARIDWWPKGTEIIRLEEAAPVGRKWRNAPPLWSRPCGRTPSGRALHRTERGYGGSAAYIVNRAGAARAIRAFASPANNTDQILFNLRTSPTARALRPVQVVPAMARQRPEESSDLAAWLQKRPRPKYRLRSLRSMVKVRLLMLLGLVSRVRTEYVP